MKSFQSLVGMAALAALGSSAMALGPDISATHTGITPGIPIRFSVTGAGGFVNPGEAGCFQWTRTGGSYTGVSGNFSTFCLELTELVAENTNYTFKVVPTPLGPDGNGIHTFPLGVGGAALMEELFGRWRPTLNTSSNLECAAFQLAVWEIVYDPNLIVNNPGLLNGDSLYFEDFGAGAIALAQTYLNAIDGTGPRQTLDVFTHETFQDQIIPAPGTLALLGLGGLVAVRRRR